MKFGIKYEQGEIVLVPFPFSDYSKIKQRPVLILSKGNEGEDVITCAITSSKAIRQNSIKLRNNNLVNGYLPKISKVRVDKIFTIEKTIINKRVGLTKKEYFESIRNTFRNLV